MSAAALKWKRKSKGVYTAESELGQFVIDGNNYGRNRWTLLYPDNDVAMVDALIEAKLWADGWLEEQRAKRARR